MAAAFDPYHLWLGIPPSEQPPNHYRLLGIDLFEANLDVIAMAADRQLGYLRTFQTGPHAEDSQRLLNEVAAARVCLLNVEKKAAYDARLRASLAPQSTAEPGPSPMDDLAAAVSEAAPRLSATRASPGRSFPRLLTVLATGVAAAVALGLVLWQRSLHDPKAVDRLDAREEAAAETDRPAPRPVPSVGMIPEPARDSPPADSPGRRPAKRSSRPKFELAPEPALPADVSRADTADRPSEPTSPVPSEIPPVLPEPSEASMNPPALPGPATPLAGPSQSAADPGGRELSDEPQLDPLLNETWAMIGRGEYAPAEKRLIQVRKTDREDVRVEFSLGLLHGLVGRDWAAAQRHFEQCLKQQPESAAVLNDLALVRLRLNKEGLALRHWDAVLAAGAPPDEVVHNLGRVAHLLKTGQLVMKPDVQRIAEDLVRRASPGAKFRPNMGFLYMGPQLAGGKTFAWPASVGYEDRWCTVCNGLGDTRCPVRDCAQGRVRQVKSEVVGRDPASGKKIIRTYTVRVPCSQCGGRGRVKCPACNEGKSG